MNRWSLLRKMRSSKLFLIGIFGAVIIMVVCVVAPLIAPFDPEQGSLKERLLSPEWFSEGLGGHILGTDQLGRDVLSRVLVGGGYSLLIALTVVIGGMLIGTTVGLVSGYFGGAVDAVAMRFVDIMMAMPTLILALCIMAVLGPNLHNLILVLVLTSWVLVARIVRGSALAVRNIEYINAARVLGAGNRQMLLGETLPNVLTPILIMASQQIGIIFLTEAGMSYLGMGVPAPTPSWGGMIADGQKYISSAPWTVVAPGLVLMVTVLVFNFLGDGVRDVLDPRNTD